MPKHETASDRWFQERTRSFLNGRQTHKSLGFEYINNPPNYFADWSMCEWGTSGNRSVKGIAEYKRRQIPSTAKFVEREGIMVPARKFAEAQKMCQIHDVIFQYFVEMKDGLFVYEESSFVNRGLAIPQRGVAKWRGDPNDHNLVVMLDWDHFHKVCDVTEMDAYEASKKREAQNEQGGNKVCRVS